MAHTLIDRLIKGAKKTILIALASSVIGCSECIPGVPNNPPYVTEFNVSPISGNAPLEVGIQFEGEDPDGKDEIVEYKLTIDREGTSNDEVITQSNPINIFRTFDKEEDIKIYGLIKDVFGASAESTLIQVKVFPNSKPEVDLSSIPDSEKNFNEEEQIIINLPIPQDPDLEDNPVPYTTYTNIESLDGKVTSTLEGDTLNGYQLIITGNKDKIRNYQIELEFGSDKGGKNTATLEGIITNLIDVSGTLEDTKTHKGELGIVQAHNKDETILLGEGEADSQGKFSIQLNQHVSEFILKAKITNYLDSFYRRVLFADSEELGYRTISFSGEDKSEVTIRAMPSNKVVEYGISKEGFITQIGETNTGTFAPELGLVKWPTGWPEEVLIFSDHPLGYGSFTTQEQGFIKERIKDPTDVPLFIRGRILPIEENPVGGEHYTINDDHLVPGMGRIIVVPVDDLDPENQSSLGPGGDCELWVGPSGYIRGAKIRLRLVSEVAINHEFGHALISPYHAVTLSGLLTIMGWDTLITKPGDADKEQGYVVSEENYKGREWTRNMLGLN